MIPEQYVPDLDLRMGLYRRLGELEDRQAIDAFAAEMIDRFGALPEETANLMKIVEVKLNCRQAMIAKLDTGPKGAVVTFADGGFPDLQGLLGYIDRLKGSAKLRPDSKLAVTPRLAARRMPGSRARFSCRAGSRERSPPASREEEGAGAGLGRDADLDLRSRDEARQLFMRQRAGTEEALVKVAAPVGEQRELAGALHALDDHLKPELASKLDHRLDDDPVARAADDVR